jgi:hypothetical protein
MAGTSQSGLQVDRRKPVIEGAPAREFLGDHQGPVMADSVSPNQSQRPDIRLFRAAKQSPGTVPAAHAVVVSLMLAAGRLDMLRQLGRDMAAERFSWAQMREISANVHDAYRAPALVPDIGVRSDAERWAFAVGVRQVLHLV